MEKITITINGVKYIIKQSFRSLMLFEEMTGKTVNKMNDSIADILKLFYCILKGNNMVTFTYSFDEWLDVIDEQPEALTTFTDYLTEQANKQVEPEVTTKKKAISKKIK